MIRAKKKPVIVDVWRWDETAASLQVLRQAGMTAGCIEYPDGKVTDLTIKTLEGEMIASNGDWIIKGVAGEFYPCKPDIFEQTYELL